MPVKKEVLPVPPPRDDEPTGAAGDILVTFIGQLFRHCIPLADVEREVERATSGELAPHLDETKPVGMLARRLADRLVTDMEIETQVGGSDEGSTAA